MITQVSKKVFKDTKGVSYSRLSNLASSPQAYLAALVDDPQSSAISLGSAVDILLTEPDTFDEQIYVMTASKPSDMMLKFVATYVLTGDKERAHRDSGFKISIDATMKKFEKEGRAYGDAIVAAKDRQILDAEDRFKANQITNTLQSNPFTKKYFIPEDGIELIFQPMILWNLMYYSKLDDESKTVQAKSVLDIIRIDHNKKIIQPIELKTGAESFMKSYWRYKRYMQGSMYTMAVHKSMKEEDLDLYTVENIRFIYADTNMYYPPRIYRMNNRDVHIGRYGQCHKRLSDSAEIQHLNTWKIKGYAQLAAELDWHQKMDKWEYSYDLYQKKGEVDIDAFTFKF